MELARLQYIAQRDGEESVFTREGIEAPGVTTTVLNLDAEKRRVMSLSDPKDVKTIKEDGVLTAEIAGRVLQKWRLQNHELTDLWLPDLPTGGAADLLKMQQGDTQKTGEKKTVTFQPEGDDAPASGEASAKEFFDANDPLATRAHLLHMLDEIVMPIVARQMYVKNEEDFFPEEAEARIRAAIEDCVNKMHPHMLAILAAQSAGPWERAQGEEALKALSKAGLGSDLDRVVAGMFGGMLMALREADPVRGRKGGMRTSPSPEGDASMIRAAAGEHNMMDALLRGETTEAQGAEDAGRLAGGLGEDTAETLPAPQRAPLYSEEVKRYRLPGPEDETPQERGKASVRKKLNFDEISAASTGKSSARASRAWNRPGLFHDSIKLRDLSQTLPLSRRHEKSSPLALREQMDSPDKRRLTADMLDKNLFVSDIYLNHFLETGGTRRIGGRPVRYRMAERYRALGTTGGDEERQALADIEGFLEEHKVELAEDDENMSEGEKHFHEPESLESVVKHYVDKIGELGLMRSEDGKQLPGPWEYSDPEYVGKVIGREKLAQRIAAKDGKAVLPERLVDVKLEEILKENRKAFEEVRVEAALTAAERAEQ